MKETWIPVVGLEDLYEVSDHGRIRVLPRMQRRRSGSTALAAGRIMRPYPMKKCGHLAIDLTPHTGPRRRTRVHIVVLEAFVGPRPEGLIACHNDGDVNNNHVSNLRWDTYSSNNHDMVQHGTNWWTKRTHCKRDHPLDGVVRRPDGTVKQRYCKTCHNEKTRVYKQLRRDAAKTAA